MVATARSVGGLLAAGVIVAAIGGCGGGASTGKSTAGALCSTARDFKQAIVDANVTDDPGQQAEAVIRASELRERIYQSAPANLRERFAPYMTELSLPPRPGAVDPALAALQQELIAQIERECSVQLTLRAGRLTAEV